MVLRSLCACIGFGLVACHGPGEAALDAREGPGGGESGAGMGNGGTTSGGRGGTWSGGTGNGGIGDGGTGNGGTGNGGTGNGGTGNGGTGNGGTGNGGTGGTGNGGATASGGGRSGGASSGGTGVGGSPAGDCARLSVWSATEAFTDNVSHPLPSFAVGRYYYVHTHDNGSSRVLYSALQNTDGSLAAWQVASTDHGGGPHGFTAVAIDAAAFHFRNGHIARYELNSGVMRGDVTLLESNPDTAFGGGRFVWDAAVLAGLGSGPRYVLHLGGFSFTGYSYRRDGYRSGVPIGSQFTDTGRDHPAARPGKAAFYSGPGASHGFVFTGESGGARLWRARLEADGALGDWQSLSELPAGTGNQRGDLLVARRTLFMVRGTKVFAAAIAANGTLGVARAQPDLPEEQIDVNWGDGHLEGAAYGIIGEFVYLTGPKRVFFARVLPAPCG